MARPYPYAGAGAHAHRAGGASIGDAAYIFDMSLTELEGLRLPAKAAQFIADGRARAAAEKEARLVYDAGCDLAAPCDDEYPGRLLEIYDPPSVLWVRGNPALLSRPGIAVVGTRAPSAYGAGMAELLSRDLANRGLAILSGMARGVDTAAHKGALDVGARPSRCGARGSTWCIQRRTRSWRSRSCCPAGRS